jgi:hypothetical protein
MGVDTGESDPSETYAKGKEKSPGWHSSWWLGSWDDVLIFVKEEHRHMLEGRVEDMVRSVLDMAGLRYHPK